MENRSFLFDYSKGRINDGQEGRRDGRRSKYQSVMNTPVYSESTQNYPECKSDSDCTPYTGPAIGIGQMQKKKCRCPSVVFYPENSK